MDKYSEIFFNALGPDRFLFQSFCTYIFIFHDISNESHIFDKIEAVWIAFKENR